LEIDRNWGREHHDRVGELGLAFYDELPRGGTGHDIAYTGFRAFCLAVALELLRFGCKQREVVELIALENKELAKAFEGTTARVQTAGRSHFIEGEPKRVGQPYSHLLFFAVRQVEAHKEIAERSGGAIKEGEPLYLPELFKGWDNLMLALKKRIPKEVSSMFVLEVSEIAARTVELLELAPLKRRGPQ
jgi:hypothetical protein